MNKKNQILKLTEKDLFSSSINKTVFNVSTYDFNPVYNKFSMDDINHSKEIYFSRGGFKICLKHRTNPYKLLKITKIINTKTVK